MSEPIATQGMIRCTKCAAIFHGKGDDIAPLGGRSIFPWDDDACAICDQWGHTQSDLEWFPDVELPEDMSTLKWSPDKILEQLSMLEEAKLLKQKDLLDAVLEIDSAERERTEKKYGSDRTIAWVKENMETGWAVVSCGRQVLALLSEQGEQYMADKQKAWWAKGLEKDHPMRVAAEEKIAEWHAKYPDIESWHDEFDAEVHIVTAPMLRYSIAEYQHQESWKRINNQLYAILEYNHRVMRFERMSKELAENSAEQFI